MVFNEGCAGMDVPGTESGGEKLARLRVVSPVEVGELGGVAERQCRVITAYFGSTAVLDESGDRMCQCRRDRRVGREGSSRATRLSRLPVTKGSGQRGWRAGNGGGEGSRDGAVRDVE